MTAPPTDAPTLLRRTRRAVGAVLGGIVVGSAASALALRWRDGRPIPRAEEWVGQGLLWGLIAVAVASHLTRRVVSGRSALRDPARRASRFHAGHVASALIAALTVPMGLAYGWFVRPRLDGAGPFWVVGVTLAVLALPRAYELDDLDEPAPPRDDPSEPKP